MIVNELTVLQKLKDLIATKLNDYLDDSGEWGETIPNINDKNVLIDFPDVDLMQSSTMFYLQPNYGEYSNLSTESDNASFNISVFILCKRDKQENLTKKIYCYFNAFYLLIKNNMDLDGEIDFCDITDSDWYPSVEGNKNVHGTEITVNCRFTKDW